VAGQVFVTVRYSDKHQASNETLRFAAPAASLADLPRVFIIASGSTASASELVINGLKLYVDVVLIGDTTYGNPYGFKSVDYCGTTYNAVNPEAVNAAGAGGYTSGIAPTCAVADDLDHALGDANEARLKAALGHISSGRCT
jgi:C-terminal processing protease CtpA/Prc